MPLSHVLLLVFYLSPTSLSLSFPSMTRYRHRRAVPLYASSSSTAANSTLPTTLESLASLKVAPKVLIFDFYKTLWTPKDIRLFPAGMEILEFWKEIQTRNDDSHPLYQVELAIASRTSKRERTEKLLDDFTIGASSTPMRSLFRYIEIRRGSKKLHLANIRTASGVPYSSMLFFDDSVHANLRETSQLGVLSCHTPRGLTTEHFVKALHKFSELYAGHDDQHWMGYVLDSKNLKIEEPTIKNGTGSSAAVPQDDMVSMQCFSTSQPFAALLLNGMKTVESRNKPMFRNRLSGTRLLVHCGWKDWHDLDSYVTILKGKGLSNNEILKSSNLLPGYDRGCVIGVVTIGRTWNTTEQELNSTDLQSKVLAPAAGIGKFCTEILEVQWLKKPIPMRGNLGVFTVKIPKDAIP